MRRRLVRIFVFLVILALLAAAGVQAVLWWSDLPRQLVVAELESQTGLSVQMDELNVGWSGRTQVRGLRLSPPLRGEAVLEADRVRVRHTALPWLLATQSVTVHQLALDAPRVHLRRNEAGRWNVLRVIEAMRGAQRPDEPRAPGPIDLPAIDVRGAQVRITLAGEGSRVLPDVNVRGRRGAALDYELTLDAEPVGTLRANLARSAPFAHEVDFDVHPPPALLALFGIEPADWSDPAVTAQRAAPFDPFRGAVPGTRFDPFRLLAAREIEAEADTETDAQTEAEAEPEADVATEPAPEAQVLAAPDDDVAPDSLYTARGQWRGRMDDAGVTGELEMHALNLPGIGQLTGALALHYRQADHAVIVRPRPMLAFAPAAGLPEPVRFTDGRLMWRDGQLTGRDVRLLGFNGEVQVNAAIDPLERVGEVHAAWRGLAIPAGIEHQGRIDLTLQREGAAHRRLDAEVQTEVRTAIGDWRGRAQLTAAGRDWRNLTGSLTTHRLRLERGAETYILPELTTELAVDAPRVRVTRVRLHEPEPQQQLAASGWFDWERQTWALNVDARRLVVPVLPEPLAQVGSLRIDAGGDRTQIRLRDAHVSGGGVVATATGGYRPGADEPLELDVRLREAPIQVGDEMHTWIDADNLLGALRVAGTVQPLALQAEGELVARSLRIYQEPVGDLTLAVRAEADHAAVTGRAAVSEWLGGDWLIETHYAYGDQPRITIRGADIDLATIDRMLGQDLALRGRADLHLITAAPETPDALQPLHGEFELRDVVREPVRADHVTGRIELLGSDLRVHDIEAQRAGGSLTGELALNLDEPTRITFDETMIDWPLTLDDHPLQIHVSGETDGEYDVVRREGRGQTELRIRARYEDRPLADLEWRLQLAGSVLTLSEFQGMLLDGTINGRGRIDLNALERAELSVRWEDVVPTLLVPVAAPAEDFEGALDGSLILGPTDHRRAIGPVRLDVELTESDAAYRRLPIGTGRLTAYFDPDAQRYVLHESSLNVAGGHAELWGRLSWRPYADFDPRTGESGVAVGPRRGGWYLFAQGGIRDIDLEVVTARLRPDEEPILGRLGGSATLSTPLHNWAHAFGRGDLTLRESDIANVPIFSVLYDVMNVRFLDAVPQGEGEARMRVDGGELFFDRFQYANRGAHFQLTGKVGDIWAGGESPVEGIAVASVSPLPDIVLLDLVNQALALLQTDVTTVQIAGTVSDPQVRLVPFRGVRRTLGRVLAGGQYEPPDTEFEAENDIEFQLEIEEESDDADEQHEQARPPGDAPAP